MRSVLLAGGVAVVGIVGLQAGAIFHNTFHPHAWLGPCQISGWLGHTTRKRAKFPENRKWRVVDGDTLFCERRHVRIDAIDAPESDKAHSKCDEERELGLKAKAYVETLLSSSNWTASSRGVRAGPDKYGRFRVKIFVEGRDLGEILKQEGLAKDYDGKGEKPSWCPPKAAGLPSPG